MELMPNCLIGLQKHGLAVMINAFLLEKKKLQLQDVPEICLKKTFLPPSPPPSAVLGCHSSESFKCLIFPFASQ